MDNNKYWASLKENEEIGRVLINKMEDYYNRLQSIGFMDRQRQVYAAYYGLETKQYGNSIVISNVRQQHVGNKRQLRKMKVNDIRNLVQHLCGLTTANRPAFECRAVNSDSESQAQATLGNQVLEYYARENNMEKYAIEAVEISLLLGGAFVSGEWDETEGDVFVPDEEGMRTTGDIKYSVHRPDEVVRDLRVNDDDKHNWYIRTTYVNKYDLAAKFPDNKDEILCINKDKFRQYKIVDPVLLDFNDSDVIPLYEFRHKRTPALPEGRLIQFVSDDGILIDTGLPYNDLFIYPIRPSKQICTNFGYTMTYDVFNLQQALESLYSTILTNQRAFGVQSIITDSAGGLSMSKISEGLNVLLKDRGSEVSPLQFTASPPEIFNFIPMLEQKMETLSGINSVTRGTPEASLKSGAALALVASQAIQYNMPLQRSYARLLELLGTGTINTLKLYADAERLASINGISGGYQVKSFKKDNLASINKVVVDVANPITKTIAGKTQLADTLLQRGLIKNPQQYMQIITTGQIQSSIEGTETENILIKKENEKLRQNQEVPILRTDNHQLHIQEHLSVLHDPDIRQDPNIVQPILNHIQQHEQFLQPQPQPQQPQQNQMEPVVKPTPENVDIGDPMTLASGEQVNQPNLPKMPDQAPASQKEQYEQNIKEPIDRQKE